MSSKPPFRSRALGAATVFLTLTSLAARGVGEEAGTTVRVRTVEQAAIEGRLVAFDPSQGLVLTGKDGAEQRLGARDVVEVRLPTKPEASAAGVPTWLLEGGDVLAARITAGDERKLRLERGDLGPIDVPLTSLLGILVPPTDGGDSRTTGSADLRALRLAAADAEDDVVVMANGDRLEGLIAEIDPKGVTIETDRGRLTLGFDVLRQVQLARVAPRPQGQPKTPPVRARLLLADGSRATVSSFEFGPTQGKIVLAGGARKQPRDIGTDRIRRIEVLGGRWQWLDRLVPAEAQHTPLLDLTWTYRVNRNVRGEPLRIGDRRFEHGLGVFPKSRLVYELGGAGERFVAGYGLDAPAGSLASVEVRVLVDGKEVHRRDDVRADGKVHDVSVDVTDRGKLELIVDFGKNGHVLDRFNWVDAAIIRK